MSWSIFEGDGEPRRPARRLGEKERPPAWTQLPEPPSWRGRTEPLPFVMPEELRQAVNAALRLRRPLLLKGPAGMGKSSVVDVIARELELGPVLRWHITSKSVVGDGLYQYDALDRLHATQIEGDGSDAAIERFVKLGPLGTALADRTSPRAVLVDEIDKSDLDLPGDLLNVIESLEFEIPPLLRNAGGGFTVRGADGADYDVGDGRVSAAPERFPVIVFTSNSERTFPPPFLRRCVRFEMRAPDEELLTEIVRAHLKREPDAHRAEIKAFADRVGSGDRLAINQLLELVHLVTGHELDGDEYERLRALLLKDLTDR
ncbi:hypothetical protein BJF79_30545 [Actinomadura sp. CNU-125]|uniref:AAA family ATPase n=1 Tax=Actinomadura sp. CNU-125 TaxID=1904961 RepID=UPI00095CAD98|nr:hypothetical protein [Actinomadura sp. CNU-125]OLT36894.1 hypothetical protein BJF79_30545 [Actinomadura sp. CNU-125]